MSALAHHIEPRLGSHRTGRTLSLTAFLLLSATTAFSQNSTIGVYTDASGSTCSFSGNNQGLVTAYVVVRPGPEGFRAIRFSAPLPACFGGSFIEDNVPTELPYIGDSQTGISIASGTCQEQPLHVLTISYLRTGSTTPCCPYPIIPEAGFNNIEVITCASEESSYASHDAHFNADETCACSAGEAPLAASNPTPANGESSTPVWTGLTWTSSDYDGDLVDFDLYLGTSADPPLAAAHVQEMNYAPAAWLDPVAHYYWRVVARDSRGSETSSPTWEFSTRLVNTPPSAPVAVSPANGATTERSVLLEWKSGDVDADRLWYDVYFGTRNPPPLVEKAQWQTIRSAYNLLPGTTYYWKIVVHDAAANEAAGNVWHFRTNGATANVVPYNASPADGESGVPGTATLSWKGASSNYRLYFGVAGSAIPMVAGSLSSPSFNPPGDLLPDTEYAWYVVAVSTAGETAGPVWHFYTGPPPSNMAVAPASSYVGPSNAAAALTWSVANPNGQPLTYDVYLGVSENPALVATTTEASFTTGALEPGVRYYWRVDTWDGVTRAHGSNWSFQVPSVGLGMGPNQPNPFNPETTIPYSVPWTMHVRLAIYDASGRLVRTLVNEDQGGGARSTVWNGADQAGRPVASGVYFCVLHAGEERRTQKLVLLK
jgi:hypothetical protein